VKKLYGIVLCVILAFSLLASCDGGGSRGTGGKARVFKPNELLSQQEAQDIVGTVVTLDESTLEIDNENGESMTSYIYDLDRYTTLHALLYLKQNGATPQKELDAGKDAESVYKYYYKICENDMEEINRLGDKAFVQKSTAHVFVLYGNYFIMTAFSPSNNDDYEASRDLNINIIKKVIDNIDRKK
jgi:hypothetical protein